MIPMIYVTVTTSILVYTVYDYVYMSKYHIISVPYADRVELTKLLVKLN